MTGFIDTNDILAALIRYAGYVVLFRYVLGYPFRSAKWAAAGIAILIAEICLWHQIKTLPLIPLRTISVWIEPSGYTFFLIQFVVILCLFVYPKLSMILCVLSAYHNMIFLVWTLVKWADIRRDKYIFITECLLVIFFAILGLLIGGRREKVCKAVQSVPAYMYLIAFLVLRFSRNYYQTTSSREEDYIHVQMRNQVTLGAMGAILVILFVLIIALYWGKKQLEERDRKDARLIIIQTNQWKLQNERQKELRAFRHDLAAHTLALQNLSKQKQYDKLDAYIDKLAAVQKSAFYISTNHIIGDAILNEYHRRGQEDGVEIQVVGMFPDEMEMEEMDLCTILSNLMSNAYEATLKTDVESGRTIRVKLGAYEDRVFLTIDNPFIGEMQIEDGELMTSKEDKDGHGYGIQNVKKALEKYGGTISWEIRNEAESSKYFVIKVTF